MMGSRDLCDIAIKVMRSARSRVPPIARPCSGVQHRSLSRPWQAAALQPRQVADEHRTGSSNAPKPEVLTPRIPGLLSVPGCLLTVQVTRRHHSDGGD
jgi:hypothetical protein